MCWGVGKKSVLAIQLAQFILGLFQDKLLVPVQFGACPVDIKYQHGHGGTERRRLAPGAAIC